MGASTSIEQALLDGAPDAIVTVGPDGLIVRVNAEVEWLFGYPREELIGESVEVLVPPAARDIHPQHRAAYLGDLLPRAMAAEMQVSARRRDGTQFPAEIRLSSVETIEGQLVCASVRDVSIRLEAQRKRERGRADLERERTDAAAVAELERTDAVAVAELERTDAAAVAELERSRAQLHQSQRMESLGQLAGGVAHDFNNLLAVIINYAAFVAEEVTLAGEEPGGERWDAVRKDLEEIASAGERATRLTHQLLSFARREVVRPQVVVLNDVVLDIEQLLRRTLDADVELVTSLADDLLPVLADPGQIEQVLVNLAVNARDAMPSGGVLTVDTENLTARDLATSYPAMTPGRFVRMRVSDTGEGMTRDVIAHAFEPFFTTKPKGEGSGLGLATAYGIITQAGGCAEIHSEPGVGTTVTALLPVTDKIANEPDQTVKRNHRDREGTVLVVDDEEAILEVTRRILTRNGFEVICADRGAQAVAIAKDCERTIDLLLTDVVMPQMLGKEVAERITEMRPDVHVLFMSGYAQPLDASPGTLDPDVVLLQKPFSETGLLSKVREALDVPHQGSE
jgi:PAS domain S-box-containing protein